jgi:sirohydrochlorin cobaltochelatase
MGISPDRRGIILLAHGSRDARWREPFDSLAHKLEDRLAGVAVRVAFLKDVEPDIYMAVDGLARSGVTQIMVVPVFLAIGGHAANDFPVMAKRLCAAHAGVKFRWTQVAGSWDEVITAMADAICAKAEEAI